MPASPDVNNYHIGKGIVSWKESGSAEFVDVGNSPSFVYQPTTEKKEHFSSREGIKVKDFTALTSVGATIKFTLDEITGQNLSFLVLGDQDTTTPGEITIDGLTKTEVVGDIKVTGTNDIGLKVDFLATVTIIPEGEFSFITDTDDFTLITISAEVQKDATTGAFGQWTIHDTVAPLATAMPREPVDERVEVA